MPIENKCKANGNYIYHVNEKIYQDHVKITYKNCRIQSYMQFIRFYKYLYKHRFLIFSIQYYNKLSLHYML